MKRRTPQGPRPRVTGLRFDRDVIDLAKHRAIDERTTLTKLIEKAIQAYLRNPQK
jgi:hypothetical protein